jgi:hypothetical protein
VSVLASTTDDWQTVVILVAFFIFLGFMAWVER